VWHRACPELVEWALLPVHLNACGPQAPGSPEREILRDGVEVPSPALENRVAQPPSAVVVALNKFSEHEKLSFQGWPSAGGAK